MTSDSVDEFIENPRTLLSLDASTPHNQSEFATAVSQYVAFKSAALPAVLSIVSQASVNQMQAIGLGLYRVVDECAGVDGDLTSRVDAAVRRLGGAVAAAYQHADALTQVPAGSAPSVGSSTLRPAMRSLLSEPNIADPSSPTLSDPFALPDIR